MLRLIRWTALSLLAVLIVLWGTVWLGTRAPDSVAGRLLDRVTAAIGGVERSGAGGAEGSGVPAGLALGGPFKLVDQSGKTVTQADFRGRWMLVYFGYTSCPDVCPTELQTIAGALDKLGPDAAKVAPLFITIDPARDTPAILADYVKLFDKRLIGLTGTAKEIDNVAREYRVYHAKVTPRPDGSYLLDHSSFAYLMGPDGRFRALLRPRESPDEMAAAIQRQMRKSGADSGVG